MAAYSKSNLEQLVKQRTAELLAANKELVLQLEEKEKRAAELLVADKELTFQSEEKADRAAELLIANKELAFQNQEKERRAAELLIANKELALQLEEKEKRAAELLIANKEQAFQNQEKEKRASELLIANKELAFQNKEKEKRAAELLVADKELTFQSKEKGKRAAELIIANKELAFQNEEKKKRATELIIANKELTFQSKEKDKRAAELLITKEKTEAKIAAINKVSQYNRNLLEASLDPFFVLGSDGIITDVNAAVEIATGLPGETLIGTDYSVYFTEPAKARAGYRKVIEEGQVLDYELKLKHISGYTTPVLFNASLYKDDEGNTIGVIAAARDITASRKFEDELIYLKSNLERLVKQRTIELLSANKELAIQSEEKDNRAAELLIADKELVFQKEEKEKRAAELLIANMELAFQNEEKEKRATELIAANKELAYQNREKEKRAEELLIANNELAFQNEEKEKRAAELLIANKELAFQNEEKEKRAAELYFANQDLAFQKEKIINLNNQLENRVIERTAQLESANKEMEALTYSISHDLKAPLRHITGYASLLGKKYRDMFPEEGRHYIDTISISARNMGELIESLLQFSRTGRIEMNKTLLNMNEIVADLIQPTREQDAEHRIEFNIDPMPLIFADLEMIKSVWSNFIENAVKFTRKKDLAKIYIGAKENETETIFYIKDNGAGFDMNYSSKLFTVFQRLHSREDYEGTGIGLATVKRIIEKHGGQTWAEGKVGEGAAFYFSLPKRKESE